MTQLLNKMYSAGKTRKTAFLKSIRHWILTDHCSYQFTVGIWKLLRPECWNSES